MCKMTKKKKKIRLNGNTIDKRLGKDYDKTNLKIK